MIHVCFHWQLHSIGRRHLQNGRQLYSHAADSVLTSGCSFIIPQIWNEIIIVLGIVGICIMIEKFSARRRSMFTFISDRQI